jgi:hypothetical protein
MKNTIYAIVEKNSNRGISLIESGMLNLIDPSVLQLFDLIVVDSIGTSSSSTRFGNISTLTIYQKDKPHGKDVYHIITTHPEEISLENAYKLLK